MTTIMSINVHMSTVTGKWEQCHANVGKCHYGSSARHIQVPSTRELDVFNRVTKAQQDIGNAAVVSDAIFRIYKGDQLSDSDVEKINDDLEDLYEQHYKLKPFIIQESALQPESNIRYLYTNGNGSHTIREGKYWKLYCLGCDFIDNERQDYSLIEKTSGRDSTKLSANSIDVGLVNGQPCYNLSTDPEHISDGDPGYQLIPQSVIDFYGINPSDYRGEPYEVTSDYYANTAYDVLSHKYKNGSDFYHAHEQEYFYDSAAFYDGLERTPDTVGQAYNSYRRWEFDENTMSKSGLTEPAIITRFFKDSGLAPNIDDPNVEVIFHLQEGLDMGMIIRPRDGSDEQNEDTTTDYSNSPYADADEEAAAAALIDKLLEE
jgi:hypothetical protein